MDGSSDQASGDPSAPSDDCKVAIPDETTTEKVSNSEIPLKQRQMADRIAQKMEVGTGAAAAQSGDSSRPLPQVPWRSQHDAMLSGLRGDANDKDAKRGMFSEMKRINALNLEPTSMAAPGQKHAQAQGRSNAAGADRGKDMKREFEASLAQIKRQENNKQGRPQEGRQQQGGNQLQQHQQQQQQQQQQGGGQGERRPSNFNPQAKEFSMNATAPMFTPGGSAGPQDGGGGNNSGNVARSGGQQVNQQPGPSQAGPSREFVTNESRPEFLRKNLLDLLSPLFDRCSGANAPSPEQQSPQWPAARGPSYREVLGQPSACGRPPPGGGQQQGGCNAPPGAWQQAMGQMPQMQMGMSGPGGGCGGCRSGPGGCGPQGGCMGPGGPQMGYMMAPGGPDQQGQMMMPQMMMMPGGCGGCGGGCPGGPAPQGGMQNPGGCGGQSGPGGCGGMPGPNGQQQGQPPFNQQAMMGGQPGQPMAMPVGMVNMQGGQGMQMGGKGGQQQMMMMPVMMSPGQFPPQGGCPQGFVPQQFHGQMPPGGPQGGCGPGQGDDGQQGNAGGHMMGRGGPGGGWQQG